MWWGASSLSSSSSSSASPSSVWMLCLSLYVCIVCIVCVATYHRCEMHVLACGNFLLRFFTLCGNLKLCGNFFLVVSFWSCGAGSTYITTHTNGQSPFYIHATHIPHSHVFTQCTYPKPCTLSPIYSFPLHTHHARQRVQLPTRYPLGRSTSGVRAEYPQRHLTG